MERIFLETAAQLVSDGSSPLSERQADALEKLSFDWILNADKYVEMRYSELYKAREKVRDPDVTYLHVGPMLRICSLQSTEPKIPPLRTEVVE